MFVAIVCAKQQSLSEIAKDLLLVICGHVGTYSIVWLVAFKRTGYDADALQTHKWTGSLTIIFDC